MTSTTVKLCSSLALALASFAHAGEETPRAASAPPVVELAICLDTSGSMQGLIDSARARIWDVVSDLATASPQPRLRVAVIQYGHHSLTSERGWTELTLDLTDDLDLVSEKLFAFTANGSVEFVGRAIDLATRELSWSEGEASMRILFIAGNESADQDREVPFAEACRRAIGKGIVVNSIYCGGPTDSDAPGWKQVSLLADGHFATIDQSQGVIAIETPFDEAIVTLSEGLNATYLPYGARGEWSAGNQAAQDGNAAGMSRSVAAQRGAAKASNLYFNSCWDLVDACKEASFDIESIPADELPEAMRTMTKEERRAHVEARAAERGAMQQRITELNAERASFLAEARRKDAGANAGLDDALRDAIRALATQRGFTFSAPGAG